MYLFQFPKPWVWQHRVCTPEELCSFFSSMCVLFHERKLSLDKSFFASTRPCPFRLCKRARVWWSKQEDRAKQETTQGKHTQFVKQLYFSSSSNVQKKRNSYRANAHGSTNIFYIKDDLTNSIRIQHTKRWNQNRTTTKSNIRRLNDTTEARYS